MFWEHRGILSQSQKIGDIPSWILREGKDWNSSGSGGDPEWEQGKDEGLRVGRNSSSAAQQDRGGAAGTPGCIPEPF